MAQARPAPWSVAPARVEPGWSWVYDRGLRAIFPFFEGAGLARDHGPLQRFHMERAASAAWRPEGIETGITGSDKFFAANAGNMVDIATGNTVTLAWYVRFLDAPANNEGFVALQAGSVSAGVVGLWYNSGSVDVDIPFVQNVIHVGYAPVVGTDQLWTVVRNGSSWFLWVDGKQIASATNATAFDTTNPHQLTVGSWSFFSAVDQIVHYLIVSKRPWSLAEHRALAADPYGPFRQARRVWALPAAGGGGLNLVRVRNESVEVGDASAVARALALLFGETVETAEARLAARILSRAEAETVEIAATVLPARGLAAAFSETVQVAETAARALALNRARAETVEIVEAVAGLIAATLVRARDEAVEIGETRAASLAAEVLRVVEETVQAVEAAVRALGLNRATAETVAAGETLALARALAPVRDETVAAAEGVETASAWIRMRAETVQALEAAIAARLLLRQLEETVAVAEDTVHALSQAVATMLRGAVRLVAKLAGDPRIDARLLGDVRGPEEFQ